MNRDTYISASEKLYDLGAVKGLYDLGFYDRADQIYLHYLKNNEYEIKKEKIYQTLTRGVLKMIIFDYLFNF